MGVIGEPTKHETLWQRIVTHPAVTGFLVMGVGFVLAIALLASRQAELRRVQGNLRQLTAEACTDRIHQWDATRAVVVQQNAIQPVSKIVRDALPPSLRLFATPGTPQYREALRIAVERRDAVLDKLGPRPDC